MRRPDRIGPEEGGVISVSDEGEFGLIRRITARLPTTDRVLLGPGDDAAVVAAEDGRVVVTTDLMVEDRHFRREWSTGYDVGRRAAAANLADVVAMGAQPTAIVVGLAAPPDLPITWTDGLADGLRDECAEVGAAVVGGDVVGADRVVVAVTALGDLQGRAPVTRGGARPGDDVVLVGRTGRAAAGLALAEAGRRDDPLVDWHRRPRPLYAAALAVAASGGATAMIDVSDGLLADLGHVAVAANVRIELTAAALPADADLLAAAASLGVDPVQWLAAGGDDHCFAATGRLTGPAAGDVTVIGRVLAPAAGAGPEVVMVDHELPRERGHEHFR